MSLIKAHILIIIIIIIYCSVIVAGACHCYKAIIDIASHPSHLHLSIDTTHADFGDTVFLDICHHHHASIKRSSPQGSMSTPATPQSTARRVKDPQTLLDALSLSKASAQELGKHHGLKFTAQAGLPAMLHAILLKLGFAGSAASVGVADRALSADSLKRLMQEQVETFAAGIKETLCAKMDDMSAQLETLQRRVDSSQKSNEDLSLKLAASTAKVVELQAQVHGSVGTSTGIQTAEMQAVVVQAAVTATADAAEMEQKKLNMRLNRLPETVKSQADAEAMVPELMEALQVDIEVSQVTYLKPAAKPSFKAALTASSTPSARTGAVLVSVKSVQAKLEVLKARKHLKDSPVFASVGVEEDLTKRQQ